MTTFKDFTKWYNDKDVVPTLQAMQKMIKFYHDNGIDMLKLGCSLPSLANRCLHLSTTSKFYRFQKKDKDLDDKLRKDIVGGPSIVFTRSAKVDNTKIRHSENLCKAIVGIDATQLYPYAMCQEMPTGLYTRWEKEFENGHFKPTMNWSMELENKVLGFEQYTRPDYNTMHGTRWRTEENRTLST